MLRVLGDVDLPHRGWVGVATALSLSAQATASLIKEFRWKWRFYYANLGP